MPQEGHNFEFSENDFLDALASLDFKLSVSESVSNSPFFTASASTGLSDYLCMYVDFCFPRIESQSSLVDYPTLIASGN